MEEKKISYLELKSVGDSISVSRGGISIASIPADKFSFTVKASKKGIDIRNNLKVVTGGFWGEILVNNEPIRAENATELIGGLIKSCSCDGEGSGGVTRAEFEAALSRISALENSTLKFDSSNNVILRDGTKILGLTETGNGTGNFVSREILGLNKYKEGTDEQFYQVEVGNMHVQTTLNTANIVNVDTEHGREYVQYVSNGGKQVITGDLSWDGANPKTVPITIDDITILVTRLNDTEVGATINSSGNIDLPITRRLTPSSSLDAIWRKTIHSTSIGTVLDIVSIGTYVLAEYWITYKDRKYYVVVGSDEETEDAHTLAKSWVEVYEGFTVNEPS